MKKVVYSVSRTNRYGSTKMTGLGFITESDLIIACNGKSGKAYTLVLDYAFRRLFGANTNLLLLSCIGKTKEQMMPEVRKMLKTYTQYEKYLEE